jgi:hypothetical protein
VAREGLVVDVQEAPNWLAARTAERRVLEMVRDFPSNCTPRDLPQGGYTETWHEDGGAVDLSEVIATLRDEKAPGFDRLPRLKAYFAREPASLGELRQFVDFEDSEVGGTTVRRVRLSEPLEQVLGTILEKRRIRDVARSPG